MKLVSYIHNSAEKIGVMTRDLDHILPLAQFGVSAGSMTAFIETATPELMARLAAASEGGAGLEKVPYADVERQAPIPVPRQDVICLGLNYQAHGEESARYKKESFERDREYAVYFSKRVDRAVPDGGAVDGHFDLLENLDYEAELAVVIGKDAKKVPREAVSDYVFGYTILNDISAREIQTRHKQWYFGKSLDGFTPMGPWIVTRDEFGFPPILRIFSMVNGEPRQDAATDLMVFSISDVVHELSRGMTLKAGTIIAMGTPAGVGMGFAPPKFLKSGDVVTCEIEGIGTLTNTIA